MTRCITAITAALCLGPLSLGLCAKVYAADPVVESVSSVVLGNEHVTALAVTFTFSDADGDSCHVALFGHDSVTREHFAMVTFAEGNIYEQTFAPGTHTVTWVASSGIEDTSFSADNFVAYVQVSDSGRIAPGRYLVIDVSGGPTADSYPVSYKEWVDVSKAVYKTHSIVLRELPDGSYAGAYEITQSQYELVTGLTPSSFGPDPTRPVETVSWNDITDTGNYGAGFIKSLRDKTGLISLDLPDETAWEFAARAGATNDFNDYTLNRGIGENWGGALADPTLENLGWYIDNSDSMTHAVGGKQGNAWGLFDMHGNVLEWTTTIETDGTRLIIRSSYWNYGAESCTVESATLRFSSTRFYGIGFRLALPANP